MKPHDVAGLLFDISVRGTLAEAFIRTDGEPTETEMRMLLGHVEMTARDLGEMCGRIGVRPELGIFSESETNG